ncbi:uncharacterized protein LOC120338513 [Styela clava]
MRGALVVLAILFAMYGGAVAQDSTLEINIPPGYDIAALLALINAGSNGTVEVADPDECEIATSCPENSKCNNTVGSFFCTCLDGYKFNENETMCNDIDECMENVCVGITDSNCSNTDGSYSCDCATGYHINTEMDACVDINECSDTSTCDSTSSDCENSEGSYQCNCKTGYQKNTDGACENIDECADSAACGENEDCTDNPGSFTCACKLGFHKIEGSDACTDVDECESNVCVEITGSECVNNPGGYDCRCTATGYSIVTADDETQSCQDIDECDVTNIQHDCSANEVCENTDGGFLCKCAAGYSGDPSTDSCTDFDECASDPCDANANCVNQIGSHDCFCETGFFGSGETGDCSEVVSCATHTTLKANINTILSAISGDDISAAEQFLNNFVSASGKATGSPGDSVRAKYDDLPTSVINVIDQLRCDYFSDCSESSGDPKIYTCTCNTGYTAVDGSTTQCEDVDECAAEPCGAMATCGNNEGSYTCTCPDGYKLSDAADINSDCTDIDECNDNLHNCHEFAICRNTPGSFECTCQDKYMGDGVDSCTSAVTCEVFNQLRSDLETVRIADGDISEAQKRLQEYSDATGLSFGGSSSSYKAKYFPGTAVIPVLQQAVASELRCDYFSECSTTSSEGGLDVAYQCTCHEGYVPVSGSSVQCVDNDECVTLDPACGDTGDCVNNQGSYICDCNSGYNGGIGAPCDDINECTEGVHSCGTTGTCTNEIGDYICSCSEGFELPTDGSKACINTNECESTTSPHNCHETLGICDDSVGSFTCKCKDGYVGTGINCDDIDECAEGGSNNCDVTNGNCSNNAGSFTCSCKSGYYGTGYDNDCLDVLSCSTFDLWKQTIDNYRSGSTSQDDLDFVNEYSAADGKAPGVSSASYKAKYHSDGTEPDSAIATLIEQGRCDYFSSCTEEDNDGMISYSCTCNVGYVDHDTNPNQCVDKNECTLETDNCADEVKATCTNNQGSFACDCNPGYDGDGMTCEDINECDQETDTCDTHASCSNTEGSHECACNDQYMGSGQADDCTNVLTCDTFEALKSAIETIRSVSASEEDKTAARLTLQNYEDASGRPIGVTQSAYRARYDTIDGDVEDVLNLLRCDFFSTCSYDDVAYTCTCITGYQDGTDANSCTDVDECAEGVENDCHANADCANTEGSYTCTCKDGFYGNGTTCSDHDECVGEGSGHNCDTNARCDNIEGGHTCTCNEGYFGEGHYGLCEDVTTCDAFAKVKGAIKTVGSSTATDEEKTAARKILQEYAAATGKPVGVSADSYNLEHDGATIDSDIVSVISLLRCDFYSTCSNAEDGAFICTCEAEFIAGNDPNTCFHVSSCPAFARVRTAIDYLLTNPSGEQATENEEILTSFKANSGHDAAADQTAFTARYGEDPSEIVKTTVPVLRCDFFSTCSYDGTYSCTCINGYEDATETNSCQDVNECSTNNGGCHADAICTNNEGSFACACKSGYTGDGQTCNDTTQCTSVDSTLCGLHATCEDTPGSYSCTCDSGFLGDGAVCMETKLCLFTEDTITVCDSSSHPLSCQFEQDFESTAQSTYNAYMGFFKVPLELVTAAASTRAATTFTATTSSGAGSSICAKTSTYSSINKAFTDSAMTMEIELFSFDCHRQWFTTTECSTTPTGVPIACNTEYSPTLALTIVKDATTGKYDVKPQTVFIASGCQASFVLPVS